MALAANALRRMPRLDEAISTGIVLLAELVLAKDRKRIALQAARGGAAMRCG